MRSSTRPTSDSNSKNKARYPTIKQQPLSTNAWSEFGLSNCVRSTEFNLILITESSDGYPFRLRGITWTHMQGRRQVADRRRGLATKTLKWRLITDPTRTSFFYSHLNVKDAPVDAALHQKTNTQTQVASRESRQFNRHDKMANDENVMQLPKKDADKKSSAEDQKTRNWIDQGGKTPVDHIHTLLHVYKLYKIYEQCAIDKICTWKAKNIVFDCCLMHFLEFRECQTLRFSVFFSFKMWPWTSP